MYIKQTWTVQYKAVVHYDSTKLNAKNLAEKNRFVDLTFIYNVTATRTI